MSELTVKDIRDAIKDLPDDAYVTVQVADGCCSDYLEVEGLDCEGYKPEPRYKFKGCLRISGGPLPGYKSCRQASSTKQSDKEYWDKFKGNTTDDSST